MALTSAKIQIRRGNIADYDKTKLVPGEMVLIIDEKEFEVCVSPGTTIRAAKAAYLDEVLTLCEQCAESADADAETATTQATSSESYAVGGTGSRIGEDTDNAKYYKEQCDAVNEEMQDAIERISPTFEYDPDTGHLSYTDSIVVFSYNQSTGHLGWQIGA